MALFNPGKAKSILDEPNRGVLDEGVQASQPAYQNAYQAVMGQGPSIGETPEWFQKQRMSFYKPTDIDTNAVDLYNSTSAQAEDWRNQGQSQYQDFTKKYGADAPWLFRSQSEGGLGLDASKYNLLADPTKRFDFKGDVGSNPYMQSLYGGDPGVASSYLEAQFNPLTGKQEGAFDLFHQYNQGPAVDTGRRGFGSFMDQVAGTYNPVQRLLNIGNSGALGSGVQRTTQGVQRQMPGYETQQNVNNKLYGYMPQGAKPAFGAYDSLNQGVSQGYNNAYSGANNLRQNPSQAPGQAIGYVQGPATARSEQINQAAQNPLALNRTASAGYASRFQNPYRRYNEYGF